MFHPIVHSPIARVLQVALVVSLYVPFFGCASITGGTHEKVSFSSDPSGARVNVGGRMGVTPTTLEVKRRSPGVATFSKEGYSTGQYQMSRGFNFWFLGNFIFGGFPGMIIDFLTGAVFSVEPDNVFVTLEPRQASHSVTVQPVQVPVHVPPAQSAPVRSSPVRSITSQPSQQQAGVVRINCNVPQAEISVNGRFVGNAPATLQLDPGSHVIEVWRKDYDKYIREINVLPGSETTLEAMLDR